MASSYGSAVAANPDLVEEIISWLPPKSVIRLKSVCRMWRDIISAPYFISDHTRRNPHKPSGILYSVSTLNPEPVSSVYASCPVDGGVPEVFLKKLALDGSDLAIVLQCSNGLLLSVGMEAEAIYLYVHNPTTGQHRILPKIDLDPRSFGAVLAFDPSRSTNYHVLVERFDINPGEIIVYDSAASTDGASSWKTFGPIGSYMSMSSFFFGGVVYWLDLHAYLVKIDIEQELINETGIRPPMQDNCFVMRLYESRGRLHLLRAKYRDLQVFELANDHSSWLLRHRVHMEDLPIHGLNLESADLIELAWENLICNCVPIEADQDDKLVVLIDNDLVAYALRSKTHVVLCSCAPEKRVSVGFACANTLVAP